jgi:hypothetical protein
MVLIPIREKEEEAEEMDDTEDMPILDKDTSMSTGLTRLALSAMDYNLKEKKGARATARRIAAMQCEKPAPALAKK